MGGGVFANSSYKKRKKNMQDGYILLNKPAGRTSFEALYPVKRLLGTKKVGHCGTLDKFAEGLLVLLTGKALKKQNEFTHLDKKYIAEVFFGKETATLDPEGEVTACAPAPSLEALQNAISQWKGDVVQTPPVYSALHINGSRASDLARHGITPEMKSRAVTFFEIELLSYENPLARIAVHCSSGAYIRALARDIALSCDSRAHLTALLRTRVGSYKLEDALTITDDTLEIAVQPIL